MTRRVVITGIGLVSPLGNDVTAFHQALCKGSSGLAAPRDFETQGRDFPLAAEVMGFSPKDFLGDENFRPLDRTGQFTTVAAHQALNASGWTRENRERREVGLVLGTMFCSVKTIAEFDRKALTRGPIYASPLDFANTVINAAAGQTAIWHGLRGVNATISTGLSSGLQALLYAADLIRCGKADALLAGGAEELCFESYFGFQGAGLTAHRNGGAAPCAIPFHPQRNGFAPGEGAALLMLEEAGQAIDRGATILAEIRGAANGFDRSRGKDPAGTFACFQRVMADALDRAALGIGDVGCISAAANGSLNYDAREAEVLALLFDGDTPVTAVKSMLGEPLGAGGAMQTISMVETLRSGELPGIPSLEDDLPNDLSISRETRTINAQTGLIHAYDHTGNACALVLTRPNDL